MKFSSLLATCCLSLLPLALLGACADDGSSTEASSPSDLTSKDKGNGKPGDCEVLDLSAGMPLASQTQLEHDTIGATPVLRTRPGVFLANGDPTLEDKLTIFVHGAAGVGTLRIDPDLSKLFTYVQSCAACASLDLDLTTNDAGASTYAKRFAAVSGAVEIQSAITPNQTQGIVRGLELREVTTDAATGTTTLLKGGQCYWVAKQAFDTRRERGCKPFQAKSTCATGEQCVPTNAIGTDGECAATGTKQLGEQCTRQADGNTPSWSSDCAAGLRCFQDQDAQVATCGQICDQLAPTNTCPAGTLCGGGYNLCVADTVLAHSGIDPAAIGEACSVKDGDGYWAMYCGSEGKQRGTCVDQDGFVGKHAKCEALFTSAATELPPGRQPGYLAYKGGKDLSTLWSYVP